MIWMTAAVNFLPLCSIVPLAMLQNTGYDSFEPLETLATLFSSSEVRAEWISWLDLGIKASFAVVGLYALKLARHWIQAIKDQNDVASQGQHADRYARAIEQISNESESIRIGGMFALQALMRESPKYYHWTVVEVLCAFIRKGSRREATEERKLRENLNSVKSPSRLPHDIEVAVAILRERNSNSQIEDGRTLQLSGANLAGANLEHAVLDGANLEHANLQNANLMGSSFSRANLERALLKDARLSRANFESATLFKASLIGASGSHVNFKSAGADRANFEGVEFKNAIFTQASLLAANLLRAQLEQPDLKDTKLRFANLKKSGLIGANCQNTKLEYANLEAANFKEANNLTWPQLKSSETFEYATLPNYLDHSAEKPCPSPTNITFAPQDTTSGATHEAL